MLKITHESHLDHGFTGAQIAFVLSRCSTRNEFFIETLILPEELGTVPCALVGPAVGDLPVNEDWHVSYEVRGDRPYPSRMTTQGARPSRFVTVIGGAAGDDPCVLYTCFGGPLAPEEVGDPTHTPESLAEATWFWALHALSRGA